MKHKGWFISIEGPDGSGKSTVGAYIEKQLTEEGYSVLFTREPGGIEIAEEIRSIILDPKNTAMDQKTEALLYAASRRQHLIQKILPAIEEGKLVLCDRFVDSSLAYQGAGRGIGIDAVLSINQFAIEGHFPDLTIYLDLSAEAGLKRLKDRVFLDRLDREALDFHQRVTAGYQEVLARFSDRIVSVDASQAPEKVAADALDYIHQRILT
ncbi:MAG: dTMP kinase [Erysipelotrichaceae bacterium]|jgi:dTMP kinase|nr:dTMP kinase [Erysipelotrichaceae bacterium]